MNRRQRKKRAQRDASLTALHRNLNWLNNDVIKERMSQWDVNQQYLKILVFLSEGFKELQKRIEQQEARPKAHIWIGATDPTEVMKP